MTGDVQYRLTRPHLLRPAVLGISQYITSLYDHNFAKFSLARALGVARTNY